MMKQRQATPTVAGTRSMRSWKTVVCLTAVAWGSWIALAFYFYSLDWQQALTMMFLLFAIVVGLLPLVYLLALQESATKKLVAILLGVLLAAAVVEVSAAVYFAGDRHGFESTRAWMSGNTDEVGAGVHHIGQPYLLYVPKPGQQGANYHNEQGYRGKAVPMQRTKGVARVLCLGGSTTYGFGVEDPDDAYPAQLQRLLARQCPADVAGVEVINGGLIDGMTSELLTHYHFKFHYFRPDLVIIHTGINDARLVDPEHVEFTFYQPDYSHFRQPYTPPRPLSALGRTLVKSRAAAWLLTLVIYGESPSDAALVRPYGLPPPTVWHPAAKQPGLRMSVTDSELAFTRNLNTLIQLCLDDEVQVLLVPCPLAEIAEPDSGEQSVRRHAKILQDLGSEAGVAVAPFPIDVIAPDNWVDWCHMNEAGCKEKAAHIASYAKPLLWPES